MDPLQPDGHVVLEQAAPADALADYPAQRAAALDGLLARRPHAEHVELATQLAPDEPAAAADPYAIVDAARALLLSPPLVALLTARFDGDPPLLFDAAETAAGAPDDGPYRDATFTALADRPETLVTIAVALGPDDATFTFHPGSQAIATTAFSGRHRAFNPERDGDAALQRHRDQLAAALGDDAPTDTITLHPGDVVAWSADLVHLPVAGAALVAHLCPTTVQPAWFAYRPERALHAVIADGAAWLTSQHYDLVDAVAPEPDAEPTDVEDAEQIERVGEALREHDEDLAIEPGPIPEPTPPSPAAARRPGGLVDSVRGLLSRRGRGR
ncbi:hypothetical protein DSM104299_04231 [Baekduia alba]|uniref:phytanoyl-CoA dioxygenase family protein n=1 Tax=Baekduia alba TaxID=2997333 RepID=UPI0023420521|nr:phytanoyl-CoA dioxygenase family protein [Baekduia alba]WCB95483.1 hypothetical protein DSM104299_04231 [Baekduia alba]